MSKSLSNHFHGTTGERRFLASQGQTEGDIISERVQGLDLREHRKDDFIYTVRVDDLYDGSRKRGYLLEITDDTAHQQHLEWIEKYNKDLNSELKAKTELIRELRHGGSA